MLGEMVPAREAERIGPDQELCAATWLEVSKIDRQGGEYRDANVPGAGDPEYRRAIKDQVAQRAAADRCFPMPGAHDLRCQ